MKKTTAIQGFVGVPSKIKQIAGANYSWELCAHNKPTQSDQDYDVLISINLPSPQQEAQMTVIKKNL